MKLTAIVLALLLTISAAAPVFGREAPKVEAKGAILIDFESGRVLFDKNASEELAMASTTKIMTAILALESGRRGETATVSRRAANAPRVKMHLSAGEKVPMELLLHALMLQSSNDAAVAIAEHLGGSVEDFCAAMTAKAREMGAVNTVFETPSGLDAGNHHSTAYDLAIITRYALNNEDFVKLINTREYKGRSDRRSYHIFNKNRLLNEYSGANGVKTGFTGKAGYCFVGSAERDGLWLISVVLASGWGGRGREQRWEDTKDILNYGFENYSVEVLVNEGQEAGSVPIERSKEASVPVVYNSTVKLPLNEEEKAALRYERGLPGLMRAPVHAGDKVGALEIFIDKEKLAEIDILAAAGAERHDLKTSMEKVLSSLLGIVTANEVKITLPEF